MKIPILAATVMLAACAFAQDQPSMPGMQMPAGPKPKQSAPHLDTPAKNPPADEPTDRAMQGMDMRQHGDQPDKPTAENESDEKRGIHTDVPMAKGPAASSIIRDTKNVQEPEDPTRKTGANRPAPDLLKDVISRQPMSLQDFLSFADRTNPTLAQAKALVRRSAAQAQQAGLYPNPSVGYQGEQIRGGSYGGGEQGGYVQQSMVLGGKLGLRRNIYVLQQQSDQTSVEEQTYRVHGDVTQAYYATLTAQATVVVRQRLVGLTLDAVETVHQLANVGQADSPDILQAEVEAEQAKIEFVTAQREFLQNFRMLAALSGQPDLPMTPLAGSLETPPELDAEQQVATIVSSSPTVKRMQQQVAVRDAQLRAARREAVPDLQLRAGEQYNFERIGDSPAKAAGPQSFVSAGISLPLWNRNQGNVSAAEAEVERAKHDVTRTQLSLTVMAEPLAQSYEVARFTADRYRTELIPRAQRAYELYLSKYQQMAMAYPQVLVSQRTLFQLQIGYLAALREEWSNAVALQSYTLSGGLEAPESTGSSSTSINVPSSVAGPSE